MNRNKKLNARRGWHTYSHQPVLAVCTVLVSPKKRQYVPEGKMGATMVWYSGNRRYSWGMRASSLGTQLFREAVFFIFQNKSRISFHSRGMKAYVIFGGDEKKIPGYLWHATNATF